MITKNEAYWERIARIKEEMLRVAFAENKALTETLAMINPQQSPWREYWEQLLKENEELRAQVKAQRTPLTDEEKHSAVWTEGEFGDGVLWAEKTLKERNT